MAINRLKIAQPTGDPKTVAFTDDILLNGLTGSGLITVTGSGQEKTVSTDASKLTLDDENVKVVTPLVLDDKTTEPSTTDNALYSVDGALYWNGQLVDSHEPGTGYVTETTFNNTIGTWSTISGTVKKAIEDNRAAIAGDLSGITAGTSGEGVTVTIGAKSNKSQTVAVSVQDGTTTQKGIVQLANTHDASDATKAATGSTVASAINTFNTNVIGAWTDGGKYTGTVKSAIESLAAISMFKVVEALPQTGETNIIYIVKPAGKTEGPYEEYIWVDNKWEKIGDTDIQLENYYKKSEVGEGFSETSTVKAYIDAVKNTGDAVDATSGDGHVTVYLTGTVGHHGLKVSTSDIASKSALSALTTRVDTAESDIDAVETKLAGIDGTTVKNYVDTADDLLDTRLDAVEAKLEGLPSGKTVEELIEAEETRAKGVEGDLDDLSTDTKDSLVAAINEVDAHANTAQTTAEGRLASISGDIGGGVKVNFVTESQTKIVTTSVSVTESTLDANNKFATTDKNVATGAKVQAAIDAAEARAKAAQTYTADGTTLQLSTDNQFSAKTAAVAQDGSALTTGGQVWTAVDNAKTALTGSATVTGTDITIKGAMHEAEAAQSTADANSTKIGTLTSLTTDAKGNLVAAINEVDAHADNAKSAADAAQSTANTAQSTANTNSTAIGTLTNLTTDAKNNLVAAINEVDALADSAVQSVTSGDTTNIKAERSGSTVTITPDGNLASLLSHLSIVQEQ